jgi:glycogen(starch) synthase
VRILILSNFYPPARPGGYTQWCHEVAERLAERGHLIRVLTSRHELTKAGAGERDVYRQLHLDGDLHYYRPLHFFSRWTTEYRENLSTLERMIGDFAPDLIFVWGMWALSKALPARAEQLLPGRVVYYLSDYWPAAVDMHTAYWQAPTKHWMTRRPKRILGGLAKSMLTGNRQPAPKFERAMCVSARVRELLVAAGLPLEHACIVHGGTDVRRFASTPAFALCWPIGQA